MYRPVLVTAPTATPVSIDEVKAHVGAADFSDDDAMLTALIAAAVSHLDGWTGILGRCLMPQTWRQDYDDFRSCMRLPLFPVASITTLKYTDTNGAEQTIAGANYTLKNDDRGAYLEFVNTYSFPSLNAESSAVRIAYVAGYADAASVPGAIRAAILLLIGHWYANREAVAVGPNAPVVLPMAVDALLAPFRRISF